MNASCLEASVFRSRVEQHGGRVDFVFGTDRPFEQCHASTLVETRDGTLLCAWFAGTKEKAPDVGIWLARFADGQWSQPERVAKVNHTAHWNPVLFREPGGDVLLFFKVGPEIPTWRTYVMRSGDGRLWTVPEELVPGDEGGRGPVRNKPIVLSNGTWVAPASIEKGPWRPFADLSTDGGKTWHKTEKWEMDSDPSRPEDGAIQPTLWESEPDHVHALLRTSQGRIGRSDSQDGGRTWSKVRLTNLPNNNSGIDALKLGDGRIVLIYNPVEEVWGPRTPLNLAVSTDHGETWKDFAHLEPGSDEGKPEGGFDKLIRGDADAMAAANHEYSYPAVVATARGIAVSYTWRRQSMRCWQIPLAALE